MLSGAVPVIDVAPFGGGTAAARRAVADAVDRACREIGFLIVTGHGVPAAITEHAFDAAQRFFALPMAARMAAAPPDRRVRGYTPVGVQGLAYSRGGATPPDLFERFRMGRDEVPDDAYHAARKATCFAPNVWPAEPADFRAALCAYYDAMTDLAARLMGIFAVALDLPETFFADKIDRHISSLCLNHYPALTAAPLPGQLRAGAHSDYGSLTIVAPTAAPGGLQVRTARGEWQDVLPPPGGVVVNIGDLMAQWTNDRWVSTLHRVAVPPAEVAHEAARLSLVFFHQPNDDALVECLPGCVAAGESPRYAPVTSGAHLAAKIRSAFEMKQASA